ncbi:MAG TPA: ACP S-malonyltransferase [Polyangiaceae bacterium]|nr:ACP S-malonyltransferase [Polyangiaceae bacterium]
MKTAWLFPGQGTQEVGMGQALASAFPEAARVFERADQALGFSIRALCFDGPIAELTLTKHTQPAIVTASIATLSAIQSAHPSLPAPDFAAGHSLGEYSALVAAGTLTLEDAVRVVHLRGQSMQNAVPKGEGGMAAIMGGDRAAVEALCAEAAEGDIVSPANFNAPGQIVISGHKRAVDRAAALAGSKKLKAIPLKVSAPFHCALMAPAARAVETALSKLTLAASRFPVVANVSAQPNLDAEEAKRLLVRQIDGPVLWEQTIALMAEAGVTHALEIGPGKVLAGLVKRVDKRIRVLSVGDPDSIAKIPEFLG